MSLVYEIAARDIARTNAITQARSERIRRRARDRHRGGTPGSAATAQFVIPATVGWSEPSELDELIRGSRAAQWSLVAGAGGLVVLFAAAIAGIWWDSLFFACLLYLPAAALAAWAVRGARAVRWIGALGTVTRRATRRAEVGFWCGVLALVPSVYVLVALFLVLFMEHVPIFPS